MVLNSDILKYRKLLEEMAIFYVRLMNQYKYTYQTVFSAKFDKQSEDNEKLDETELFKNWNIIQSLKESDVDNIDDESSSEHH